MRNVLASEAASCMASRRLRASTPPVGPAGAHARVLGWVGGASGATGGGLGGQRSGAAAAEGRLHWRPAAYQRCGAGRAAGRGPQSAAATGRCPCSRRRQTAVLGERLAGARVADVYHGCQQCWGGLSDAGTREGVLKPVPAAFRRTALLAPPHRSGHTWHQKIQLWHSCNLCPIRIRHPRRITYPRSSHARPGRHRGGPGGQAGRSVGTDRRRWHRGGRCGAG